MGDSVTIRMQAPDTEARIDTRNSARAAGGARFLAVLGAAFRAGSLESGPVLGIVTTATAPEVRLEGSAWGADAPSAPGSGLAAGNDEATGNRQNETAASPVRPDRTQAGPGNEHGAPAGGDGRLSDSEVDSLQDRAADHLAVRAPWERPWASEASRLTARSDGKIASLAPAHSSAETRQIHSAASAPSLPPSCMDAVPNAAPIAFGMLMEAPDSSFEVSQATMVTRRTSGSPFLLTSLPSSVGQRGERASSPLRGPGENADGVQDSTEVSAAANELKRLVEQMRATAVNVTQVGEQKWRFRGPVPGLGVVEIQIGRDGLGNLEGLVRVPDESALDGVRAAIRAMDPKLTVREESPRTRWSLTTVGGFARRSRTTGSSVDQLAKAGEGEVNT